MALKLTITAGPHKGQGFEFDGHDTLLVGRASDAHCQLSDDKFCSSRHFLIEANPPRCRVINLSASNGTFLNGKRVDAAELSDGDEVTAGKSTFKLECGPMPLDDCDPLSVPAAIESETVATEIIIPGYLIESELGRSGTGLYRATRESDGIPVALRIIDPGLAASRQSIERFLTPAKALIPLQHPNIVAVFDAGEASGVLYVVMELVEGQSLAVRMAERGPEDVRTSVRIICQALGGLVHAHEKGILHGDIKPSNILIGSAGDKRVTKLADFGLARAAEGLAEGTFIGDRGPVAYLAPELVTHHRYLTPAADQYAAAATLYHLLAGEHTRDLPADKPGQIAQVVTADPVHITVRRPDVPAMLATVIHTALRRDPEERFPTTAAFRKALKLFS